MTPEAHTYDPADAVSALEHGRRLIGTTVGSTMHPDRVTDWERNARSKGDMGHAIEFFFGVERNSEAAPDIPECGVEIKAVPVHFDRGMMTVKERCYLGQIPWTTVRESGFPGTSSDLKTRRILFVFYRWVKDQNPLDTTVLDVALWERDELTSERFEQAWDVVRTRLAHGVAHLASAGDSPVVAAATKGAGSWTPPSGEPVKSRAWAIKQDHMQLLMRQLTDIAPFPRTSEAYANLLTDGLRRFRGWSARDLARKVLGVKYSDSYKSYHRGVAARLIGYLADLSERGYEAEGRPNIAELRTAGLNLRAMRIDVESYLPAEDISFRNVTYDEIVRTPFGDHWISAETRDMALVLFTEEASVPGSRYLDTLYWRPSGAEIAALHDDYERIRSAVAASDLAQRPSEEARAILRLGTKDRTARTNPQRLPDGKLAPRPNFYLDKSYLRDVIAKQLPRPAELRPQPVRLVNEAGEVRIVRPNDGSEVS